MDSPPPQGKSLLDLPGELRNRIYRYALLQNATQSVTHAHFREPNLLWTCKLIRHEAASIFYAETEFVLELPECDSGLLPRWIAKAAALSAVNIKMSRSIVNIVSPRDWANLKGLLTKMRSRELNTNPRLAYRVYGCVDSQTETLALYASFGTTYKSRALSSAAFERLLALQ